MEFLDKLYASNYFGIGLFIVISFLVVTFLVVLFFGKRDEKRRQLEGISSTGEIPNNNTQSTINTFKEVQNTVPLEVPVDSPVISSTPLVEPVNNVFMEENLQPVAPIKYEDDTEFIDNLRIEEPVEAPVTSSVIDIPSAPEVSIEPNIVVEPIRLEPTKLDVMPSSETYEEMPQVQVEPLIKEEVKPIITEIVEEPVIETYYKPIEKTEVEEIKVPDIDFDALAASISKELDELEKTSDNKVVEEVKVTPMSEISSSEPSQFSSVYINRAIARPTIDLPKKIDLPDIKNPEIEPESYKI